MDGRLGRVRNDRMRRVVGQWAGCWSCPAAVRSPPLWEITFSHPPSFCRHPLWRFRSKSNVLANDPALGTEHSVNRPVVVCRAPGARPVPALDSQRGRQRVCTSPHFGEKRTPLGLKHTIAGVKGHRSGVPGGRVFGTIRKGPDERCSTECLLGPVRMPAAPG